MNSLLSSMGGRARFGGAVALAGVVAAGLAQPAAAQTCSPTLYVNNALGGSVKITRIEVRALPPGWDQLRAVRQSYVGHDCRRVLPFGRGAQKIDRCVKRKALTFPKTEAKTSFPAGSRFDVTVSYDRLVKGGRRWGDRKSVRVDGKKCSGPTRLLVTLR